MIKYSKEKLKNIVNNSLTYHEVLQKFKRNDSSTSYRILKKHLKEWTIDVSHFLTKKEIIERLRGENKLPPKIKNEDLFIQNSTAGRANVKKRILNEKLIEYKCQKCNSCNIWNGEKLSLILDHINGIRNDNRLENLRFLCPNCNATLKTHCKGSKGLIEKIDKRKKRKDVFRERLHLRKVQRPSKEQLKKEISELGFSGTGRKYGVSDNAIRKWIKNMPS